MSQDDDSEDVFSISGTMMIVDEEGGLVNQVRSDVAELIKIIIHEFDEISVSRVASVLCVVCRRSGESCGVTDIGANINDLSSLV